MADSLFEAVANALHWWEVECQHFGTAHRLPDSAVLEVHLVAGERYWVRVGRVREWIVEMSPAYSRL